MDSFITQSNKQLLWNTIVKIPLFNKINKEEQIKWFETQVYNIYAHNKTTHAENKELLAFNKDALKIMINIFKNVPEKIIHVDAEHKTPEFEKIEDKALPNLNELVEEQRQRRELDIHHVKPKELNIINLDEKKTVSWEDEVKESNVIEELKNKIKSMEVVLFDMRKEMDLIKQGIYKEVNQSMSKMINSVIEEN